MVVRLIIEYALPTNLRASGARSAMVSMRSIRSELRSSGRDGHRGVPRGIHRGRGHRPTTVRAAAAILSADGISSASRVGLYGMQQVVRQADRGRRRLPRDARLGQLADDGGAPATLVPLLLGDDQATGLAHRRLDRRVVDGSHPAQVDDLGADAVGGERFGGRERPLDHQQGGQDGHVRALAHDARGADVGDRAPLDEALAGVQHLVLVEQHRVVVADGRPQQLVRRLG